MNTRNPIRYQGPYIAQEEGKYKPYDLVVVDEQELKSGL